jgi:hypothetical protein
MSEPARRPNVFVAIYRLHKFAFTDAIVIPVLGFILLLLCWGVVGRGMGTYHVIWKDSPGVPVFDRAVFWSGFGVALFFTTCAHQIYILYSLAHPEQKGRRFAIVLGLAAPLIAAAHIGMLTDPYTGPAGKWPFPLGALVAILLFRLIVRLLEGFGEGGPAATFGSGVARRWWAAQGRWSIQTLESVRQFWLRGMAIATHVADEYLTRTTAEATIREEDDRRPVYRFSFGLYAGVIAAYALFVGFTLRDGSNWHWFGFTVFLAAMAGAIVVLWTALWLATPATRPIVPGPPTVRDNGTAVCWHLTTYGTAAIAGTAFGYFVRFLLAIFAPWETGEILVVPAALSLVLLLGVIGVLYGALKMFAGPNFYTVGVGLVVVAIVVGMVRPYPHRLAALGEFYGPQAVSLPDFDPDHALDGRPESERPLCDECTLAAWSKRLDPDGSKWGGKPPLVIVSMAGGGSTSAIYTFEALVAIEKEHPGFHRHIRLMSGASGGMLGAAVYRTWLRDLHELEAKRPANATPADIAREIEKSAAPYRDGLAQDFLSPLAQALAFKDIPMGLLCPRGYADDRGRRLEQAWNKYFPRTLDSTFDELRDEERDGAFPSLVFSPMMVEPGRPLLISTIDLAPIASAARDDPYPDRIRGVEFMKLFPREGWNLRLGSAARLSATFPFFTPAVSLPTLPGRRVVDAGYYDNYGVSVGLAWLQARIASTRLSRYVGDVILLELKPYGKWVRSQAGTSEVEAFQQTLANWPRAFHELSTPVEGLYNARDASMSIRNDDQRDQVTELMELRGNGQSVPLFTPYVFRGGLDTSLNWSLPRAEVEAIRHAARSVILPLDESVEFGSDEYLNRIEWEGLKDALAPPKPPRMSESKPTQSGAKK